MRSPATIAEIGQVPLGASPHDDPVQASIAFIAHTISQCLVRIIDVDLSKNWRLIWGREKRASTVREFTMNFE